MTNYDLTVLSLGAGVQSSALLVASNLGLYNTPRCDVAIFADTCAEPWWVYAHLWRLAEWSEIPIVIVREGRAGLMDFEQMETRNTVPILTLPYYTPKPCMGGGFAIGKLRHQCTREYKIQPITREIRRMLGVEKGKRVKGRVLNLHGISYEESQRCMPSRDKWMDIIYPLVDARLTRADCLRLWVEHTGLPIPRRSACIMCPFRCKREWQELKADPVEWARVVEVDRKIRELPDMGGLNLPVYVHRSCKPIEEVDFSDPQM